MQTGVSAAVAAMEQAVRRLDAALAQRGAAFRSLAEQHGQVAVELKATREALQAARDEAGSLRERAALVDALREELALLQAAPDLQDYEIVESKVQTGQAPVVDALRDQYGDPAATLMVELTESRQALAAKDAEINDLKAEADELRTKLASAVDAKAALQAMVTAPQAVTNGSGDVAALKAELAAAKAAQTEMQAFQSGVAARLEATMARLRQALDADSHV